MELSKDDIGFVHDVMLDATGLSHSDRFIINIVVPGLPESVKLAATEWGWGDTEVREAIYKLFNTN